MVVLFGSGCLIRLFCQFASRLDVNGLKLILIYASRWNFDVSRDGSSIVGVFGIALLPYLLLAVVCLASIRPIAMSVVFCKRRYGIWTFNFGISLPFQWCIHVSTWLVLVLHHVLMFMGCSMIRKIALYGPYQDEHYFLFLTAEAIWQAAPFGVFCCVWGLAVETIDCLLVARQHHLAEVVLKNR
jgi:hypothetical protein